MQQPITTGLELADIHLPTEPGIFPLAWGWWLIIISSTLFLLLIFFLVKHSIQKNKAKKQALIELDNCSSVSQINSLLKRAALSYYPREQVASLTGTDWLSFLDAQLKSNKGQFKAFETQWLSASFSQNHLDEETLTQAKKMAKNWLKKALPAPKLKKNKEQNHV